MRHASAATRSGVQRGFTLIELLVTIVILGFVIGLMSGAFTQVAQILRISADSGNGFQERWLRSRALQELVANLAPGGEDADSWPSGTAESLDCRTLASPLSQPGLPQRVRVSLAAATSADGRPATELRIRSLEPASPLAREERDTVWTGWPGRLRFAYIDRTGQEYPAWPPTAQRREELPSEILVRPEQEDRVLVRTAVFEGPLYRPKSADMNQLRDFLGFGR